VGGFAQMGSAYDCINLGTIIGRANVGGIYGAVVGGITVSHITNCANYGWIKGTSSTVGGIVGYHF